MFCPISGRKEDARAAHAPWRCSKFRYVELLMSTLGSRTETSMGVAGPETGETVSRRTHIGGGKKSVQGRGIIPTGYIIFLHNNACALGGSMR